MTSFLYEPTNGKELEAETNGRGNRKTVSINHVRPQVDPTLKPYLPALTLGEGLRELVIVQEDPDAVGFDFQDIKLTENVRKDREPKFVQHDGLLIKSNALACHGVTFANYNYRGAMIKLETNYAEFVNCRMLNVGNIVYPHKVIPARSASTDTWYSQAFSPRRGKLIFRQCSFEFIAAVTSRWSHISYPSGSAMMDEVLVDTCRMYECFGHFVGHRKKETITNCVIETRGKSQDSLGNPILNESVIDLDATEECEFTFTCNTLLGEMQWVFGGKGYSWTPGKYPGKRTVDYNNYAGLKTRYVAAEYGVTFVPQQEWKKRGFDQHSFFPTPETTNAK